MSPHAIKLRLIYLPFLAVLASMLAGYTTLYWWLVIDLQVKPPGNIVLTWIVPLLLAVACSLLFLYRRVNLLALKRYRANPMIGYMLGIVALLTASVITTQYFLIDVAGKMIVLDTPDSVGKYPNARYFTINQYKADVSGSHAKVFSSLTGKRKVNMAHDLIIALPLYAPGKLPPANKIRPMTIVRGADGKASLEKATDYPGTKEAPAWICYQYHTLIKRSLSEAAKQEMFQQFSEAAYADFQELAAEPFTYLRNPLHKGTIDRFGATVREGTGNYAFDQVVLEPVFTPFEERYEESLLLSVGCILGTCLIMLAMVLVPALDYPKWEKLQRDKERTR